MSNNTISRFISLALLSMGGLLLEISLTRFFSTLFYPPYVFAILSLAILGIGLGAAAATSRPSLRHGVHVPLYTTLAGLSTLVLIIFAVQTAALDFRFPLLGLVVLPYFWIGLALATFFSMAADESPRLYLADLVGAGLGVLLSVPVLNLLGALHAHFLVAAVLGSSGLVIRWPSVSRGSASLLMMAVVGLVSNLETGWLDLDMASLSTQKPITESLTSGGRLVRSIWDAFARTDLVDPADGGPYRLYIDGAAGSIMPPSENNDFLIQDIGLFPFATAQPERVFVIGPGGGLDVWFGLQTGATEIVAVEVNRASVALVRAFAGYNGGLYDQPAVRVVIDEGRSVLRREKTQYDLIFLSQVVTLAAERSGYALTENTVYTMEAFAEYLAHLNPAGQIAIKLYDEPTLTRALSTVLAVFREQGMSDADALRHTAAFLDPRSQPPIPLLIIRKSQFTRPEALELGAVARRVGFVPLYLPDVWAEPPLDGVQAGTVPFADIVARSEIDISPTTDDRPFFYQFERGIPRPLRPLVGGLALVLLVGMVLLVFVQRRVPGRCLRWAPVYFAALGVGFMAVEVAIIQQTRLFLGHPTLAVTTVLAVLLLGGGLGSGVAGRRAARLTGWLPTWPAASVVGLVLAWVLVWSWLSRHFLAAGPFLRVLVVAGSLLPLALAMGMPFPLGLRVVGRGGERHVALAWAVNGVMTVVGSAGAVVVALLAGFRVVLLLGVVAYAVAAGVAFGIRGWDGALRGGKIVNE